MRGITGTLVVLLAVGYFASTVEWSASRAAGAPTSLTTDGWRRTAQGWEHQSQWATPLPTAQQPIAWHMRPWTLAALQVIVSLLAFWIVCPGTRATQCVTQRRVDAPNPGSPHPGTA
jgi:hypothetical protein